MPGKQTDPEVRSQIAELALGGWTAPQIQRRLSHLGDRLPSLRTIHSIAADLRPPTGTGWRLADADPTEAALVLPVMAAVTRNSDGRLGHFTKDTAAWIARIRTAAPSLAPIDAYRWAVRYQTAVAADRDSGELDLQLALDTVKPPRREDPAGR